MTRDEIAVFLDERSVAYRRRDAASLAAQFTDDAKVSSPMFGAVQGRAAIEGSYRSLFTAFPDWEMNPEPPVIDGNRVAQFFHVTGTHSSEMFGLPGTGKRVEFKVVIIFTFENGLIAQEQRVYDFTSVLMQMGVLRGRPTRT